MENTENSKNVPHEEFSFEEKGQSAEVGSIDSFFDDDTTSVDITESKENDLFGKDSERDELDLAAEAKDDDVPLEIGNKQVLEEDKSSFLSSLIDKGLIDSNLILEDEDGSEVPILEADLSDEDIVELLGKIIEDKVEDSNKDKISIKGVSDFTKKLIEIENNGGNVKQALESYEKFKAPMDELDITTVDGQYEAIYLTLEAKGLSEKDIKSLIETYDSKGELEERAKKAKEDLDTAFNRQMEKLNQDALSKKEEWKEFIKKYSLDIKQHLNSSFELNETIINKIVNLTSKEDKDGKYELEKLYNDKRRDPKEAAKLALFLFDSDEYDKQVSNKKVDENNRKTFSKMKLSRSNSAPSKGNRVISRNKKEISITEFD